MALKTISIKSLYALALAEGEGVGTAYEYFAKRLVLGRWLAGRERPALSLLKRPSRILIAGLPEKYGSSLDFLQLAVELGADVTVADERPSALEKLQNSLDVAQEMGWLTAVTPKTMLVTSITALDELDAAFDLCISSEVLQRQAADERPAYVQRLRELGTAVAIFAPNGDNPAHAEISGLASIRLDELHTFFAARQAQTRKPAALQTNYVDMPPFPPGITRSDEQREQATSGRLEAVAMWGLGLYARAERFLPRAVRRSHAHIVYALCAA